MAAQLSPLHSVWMAKKRKAYRRTFIRQWRQHRGLTLEQLADRVEMTPSGLSMLERGQSGYTQERLEQLALALSTDPASLLMRDPSDPDAIWSIWDNASPVEKRLITEIASGIKRAAKAS